MSFADRSRGYVPRLKEDLEGGHPGVKKCVENPWSFCNFPTPSKESAHIPYFPQPKEWRDLLSLIDESRLLNTFALPTTTKFFI
jgi:hypothetical protein